MLYTAFESPPANLYIVAPISTTEFLSFGQIMRKRHAAQSRQLGRSATETRTAPARAVAGRRRTSDSRYLLLGQYSSTSPLDPVDGHHELKRRHIKIQRLHSLFYRRCAVVSTFLEREKGSS
ncbi:hypothetical protein EVAR_11373_1 [Eumeta japonica]|uniref:Uncharacterized protein n=1 Tax=Eumeta variegata TaxID=151549 RepID=A0A4C1U0U4_EUMVA|nr:hypothetical protein EVAR_11373_1 [Eumeta japonica]